MPESTRPEDGDVEAKICNVCHLPYTGDECQGCKAEREQTMAVVQERGRRHRDPDLDEERE